MLGRRVHRIFGRRIINLIEMEMERNTRIIDILMIFMSANKSIAIALEGSITKSNIILNMTKISSLTIQTSTAMST
jgi:hypothetical protein